MPGKVTPRPSPGATVIELLVALAITAGMAAVMLTMTSSILKSWRSASGSLSARAQARRALDRLQLDLEQAVFRPDGNVWFAVEAVRDPDTTLLWEFPEKGTGKPVAGSWDPARHRFGWGGNWLRFFIANGDIRAVSYKIVRRRPTTRAPDISARYMLYRGEVGGSRTFGAGYDILAPDYNPGESPGGPVYVGHPGEIQRPRRDSVLAGNVVDFGVRLYWRGEIPGTKEMDYLKIFPWTGKQLYRAPPAPGKAPVPPVWPPGGSLSAQATITRIPNVAEISLRILTDEGAGLLSEYEAGRIEGDWWEIVEEHSKLFTRRVVLRSVPQSR